MRAVPQKIEILKFVGEQGIVSIQDISRHLFNSDKFRIIRSTLYSLGVAHIRYRNVYGGLWYVDNPKVFSLLLPYYPKLPAFLPVPILDHLILHYLEINRIRSTFEQSKEMNIEEWWSEHYMRALPSAFRSKVCNPKIPDAVFWRRKSDGTRQKFFVEYERSLKSPERYAEIFSAYIKRPDVKRNVLYLCDTPHIREYLVGLESRLVQRGKLEKLGCFQFLVLEDMYKHYEAEKTKREGIHEENPTVMQDAAV